MQSDVPILLGKHQIVLRRSDSLVAVPRSDRMLGPRRGPTVATAPMHEGAAPYEVVRRSPATDAYPASTPIYHTSNDLVPFIPTGTIYLEFNGGVSEASKREIIDKHGLDLIAIKEDGSAGRTVGLRGAIAFLSQRNCSASQPYE